MSSNNSRKQKALSSSTSNTHSKNSRSKTPTSTTNGSSQQRNKHSLIVSMNESTNNNNICNGTMNNDSDSMVEKNIEKMKQFSIGKSNEEMEFLLRKSLQEKAYEDTAYLIASSNYLESKFKTSDVIRLMLENQKFDRAAKLIRGLKMQSNQLLVTLFIKELIRHNQFIAAVKYAQEMVTNFGKKEFTSLDTTRPSWTPQALVQAMIRAKNYRYALKFAKQFKLLEIFSPDFLITKMLETKQWEEAISAVMEYKAFDHFPLEKLIFKMIKHHQWNLAMKCINKITSPSNTNNKYIELLVREASCVGHFLIALNYMREFKLDQPKEIQEKKEEKIQKPNELVRYFVIQLIQFAEYYKAIKYAQKFGLSKSEPEIFGTEKMILQAMEHGQYHVASTYIQKFHLKEQFALQLVEIDIRRKQMAQDFRAFVCMREKQQTNPQIQFAWNQLMQQSGYDEEKEQYIEVSFQQDIILEEQTEIFCRKNKEIQQVPMRLRRFSEDSIPSIVKPSSGPVEGQSRFDFARFAAAASIENSRSVVNLINDVPRTTQPPILDLENSTGNAKRILTPPSLPSGLLSLEESNDGSNAFSFSKFASNFQQTESMTSIPKSTHTGSPPPTQSPCDFQPSGLQYSSFSPPQPLAPSNFASPPQPPPPPPPASLFPVPPAPSLLPTGYFLHPMQQQQQQQQHQQHQQQEQQYVQYQHLQHQQQHQHQHHQQQQQQQHQHQHQHQHHQQQQQQQQQQRGPMSSMPQNLPSPAPPSVATTSSNVGSDGIFDISSLAMQFHKPPQASASPSFSLGPGPLMPPHGPPMTPFPPHFYPGYMHGPSQPMPMHHQLMQPPPVRSSFIAVPPPSIDRHKR